MHRILTRRVERLVEQLRVGQVDERALGQQGRQRSVEGEGRGRMAGEGPIQMPDLVMLVGWKQRWFQSAAGRDDRLAKIRCGNNQCNNRMVGNGKIVGDDHRVRMNQ